MSTRKSAVNNRDIIWSDVVYRVLKNWPTLIIMMVVFAGVAFVFGKKYNAKVKVYNDNLKPVVVESTNTISEEEKQAVVDEALSLSEDELKAKLFASQVSDVYALETDMIIFNQAFYSTIWNFASYTTGIEMQYVIKSPDSDDNYDYASLLCSYIDDGKMSGWIESAGLDYASNANNFHAFVGGNIDNTEKSNVVTIYFFLKNPAENDGVIAALDQYVVDVMNMFNGQGANLYATKIHVGSSRAATYYFKNKKSELTLLCQEKLSTMNYRRSLFNAYQQALYNLRGCGWQFSPVTYVDPSTVYSEEPAETEAPKIHKKKTLPLSLLVPAGAAGAFALYCVIVFFATIFSGKISFKDDYYEIFGLYSFDRVKSCKKKKFFINRAINKINYAGISASSEDESIERISSSVSVINSTNKINKLAISGLRMDEHKGDVCNKIKEALKALDIDAVVVNNVLTDSSSLALLNNVDSVIMVETADRSKYNEVFDEIELYSRQNIRKLGIIVFES